MEGALQADCGAHRYIAHGSRRQEREGSSHPQATAELCCFLRVLLSSLPATQGQDYLKGDPYHPQCAIPQPGGKQGQAHR